MREECPNCREPDPAIEPCTDGTCGVCAGKGFITWEAVGELKSA